jgi:PKD repeat protein
MSTGVLCRVIVEAPASAATMSMYLNPTSGSQGSQTPYAINSIGSGTPPTSVGSFVISQFGSGTAANNGVSIEKVVVANSFNTAYWELLGIIPPTVNLSGTPRNGVEPLLVGFTDLSTGTITNRFWDFGDGATTNTVMTEVAHGYQAGVYDVTLIASGAAGVSTNRKSSYIAAYTAYQAWQIIYFGGTNNPAAGPDADPDADGQSNLNEFFAATNPTNNGSVLRMTGISQEGDNIHLRWSMGSGRTNVLQVALDSPAGDFANLFTISNTIGTVTDYVHIGAVTSSPSRYYRVRLSP